MHCVLIAGSNPGGPTTILSFMSNIFAMVTMKSSNFYTNYAIKSFFKSTVIDENDEFLGVEDVPTSPEVINKCLKYRCVVYHPTFFLRKEVFNKVGGYRKEFIHAQDYDFLLL